MPPGAIMRQSGKPEFTKTTISHSEGTDQMAEDFDEELYEEGYEEEERDPYLEINELKQKLSLLQKTKEAQRARYKKEMHMIVNALITKHRELQKENHYLQKQIKQLMGEEGQNDDFLVDLKQTIADQKKEVTILKKLVERYESESKLKHQEKAELEALQELIAEKDQFISELEDKNQEFLYQVEAKDSIISRISTQVANLEAEIYAMNKRIQANGSAEDKASLEEINRLKEQILELEAMKGKYENIAREAQAQRNAARDEAAKLREESETGQSEEADAAEASADEEYEEAMDMLLEELQENLSTYDQISTQFSKART